MTREDSLRQADAALAMVLADVGGYVEVIKRNKRHPYRKMILEVLRARDRLADMIMAGEV